MRHRSAVVLGAMVAASLVPVRAASAQEFQVNSYTTAEQAEPIVASTPDGRFVVVWESSGQDGSGYGIFGQRYDAKGAARGAEFRANTYTTGLQRFPSVGMAPDGSFVVVWTSMGQDGDGYGIFGQHYDAAGNPVGSEFQVNTDTTGYQSNASVAGAGTGFVIVWSTLNNIQARRFDSAGAPVGPEFRVDTYDFSAKLRPKVAAAGDGRFVVAWTGDGQPGEDSRGIVARRFDPSGSPLGGEIAVNGYTTSTQQSAQVAVAPDGRFVVAWSSYGQDGSNFGGFARVFDAAGAPLGPEFQVNTFTTGRQATYGASMAENGDFVVVWEGDGQDGSSYAVVARRYDSLGAPKAAEFVVNTTTYFDQRTPAVASAANGRFTVVWQSPQDPGGGSLGIVGRRIGAVDGIFADGFESADMSAWSSASTDGTDLSVAAGAALHGTSQGLRALVNDTNSLFVRDDSPASETRYRARFYLDPNGFDPGEASGHQRVRVLLAQDSLNNRLVTIVLKRLVGQFSVMARVRLKDGSRTDTPFIDITDAPHAIELDWQRAGSVETSDGTFELFIDGASVATLSGLDDGDSSVDYVRMGAFSVKSGATGILFLDQFVSRRRTLIGP
jgi:hypothetical protein